MRQEWGGARGGEVMRRAGGVAGVNNYMPRNTFTAFLLLLVFFFPTARFQTLLSAGRKL